MIQSPPPEGFGGESKYNDQDVAYRLAMFWNDRQSRPSVCPSVRPFVRLFSVLYLRHIFKKS